MKMDCERLKQLQVIMYKLSDGIDPTSDIAFAEDTILNNSILKKAFLETSDILADLIRSGRCLVSSKTTAEYKMPFHLFQSEIEKVQISDVPITVSRLAYALNEVGTNPQMKKLKATQITFWLTSKGLLEIAEIDQGNQYKIPTESGKELGIFSEIKTNSAGKTYAVNYYSDVAQKFIVSNINQITGYVNE